MEQDRAAKSSRLRYSKARFLSIWIIDLIGFAAGGCDAMREECGCVRRSRNAVPALLLWVEKRLFGQQICYGTGGELTPSLKESFSLVPFGCPADALEYRTQNRLCTLVGC